MARDDDYVPEVESDLSPAIKQADEEMVEASRNLQRLPKRGPGRSPLSVGQYEGYLQSAAERGSNLRRLRNRQRELADYRKRQSSAKRKRD